MARISMIQKHETVTAQKAFSDFIRNCKIKNLAQKTVKNYDASVVVLPSPFPPSIQKFAIQGQIYFVFLKY